MDSSATSTLNGILNKIKDVRETYALLKTLSSINGIKVSRELLDRVMFSFEALPPLGKEYWWFLFFGTDGRQMMLLIFRKHGRKMIFNDREFVLRKIDQSTFQAITTTWIYDGKEMHDQGANNSIIIANPRIKTVTSEISNRKMVFSGSFPEYELKIDDLVHLKMKKGDLLENRCAHGVFIPPFGAGWIDVFSNAEGSVLGEEFKGTAHLQKVIGIMPYGSFHWARVIFQKGSMFSFFCLKTGKGSKKYFHSSMNFYYHKDKRHIRFKKLRVMILDELGEALKWTINGYDGDNKLKIILKAYAEKSFIMNGIGSQTYIEYAVKTKEFIFETKDLRISLKDLGEGIGTFEDAYN